MKLSDAIRLGSMTVPQHFGTLFLYVDPLDSLSIVAACAAGSALFAIGAVEKNLSLMIKDHWPWTADMSVTCPNGDYHQIVCSMIVHLNDGHRWTREQIADWVATIEPPDNNDVPAFEESADVHA
jgi:hypothetical protein